MTPALYKTASTAPLPDWVNRANRAHVNAVENFGQFFARTVLFTLGWIAFIIFALVLLSRFF